MRSANYVLLFGVILFLSGLSLLGFHLYGLGIVLNWLLPPLLWLAGGVLIAGWAMSRGLRASGLRVVAQRRAESEPAPPTRHAA